MSNVPQAAEAPIGQGGMGLTPEESRKVDAANPAKVAAAAAAKAEEKRKKAAADKAKAAREAKKKARYDAQMAQWETTFKQQYPQYAWMFDEIDRTKYADVFNLFNRKIDPKVGLTDDRFEQEFQSTSWYREIQSSNKIAEINNAVGTLDWGPGTLSRFANKAVGMGWKEDQLKQEAYKEIFAKNQLGEYLNKQAVDTVRNTGNYLRFQNTAKQFFTTLGADKIEKALTGQITEDDVLTGLRAATKLKYSHLSEAIDAGQTLEDLAADYKKTAASILERNENDIDMTNPDFEKALAFDDGKGKRMMTTGEWARTLKTDNRYGWGSTQNAIDTGRKIAMNIVKSFQRGF